MGGVVVVNDDGDRVEDGNVIGWGEEVSAVWKDARCSCGSTTAAGG